MKLVSKVALFAALAAVFSFVSAEKADAQILKRIFGGCGDGYSQRGIFCRPSAEEAAPEAEAAPEPEPAPMMCCEAAPAPEPAPEPAPMMCCEPAPAPEPAPMPCCAPAPAPEPAPIPCCEPAPPVESPCCASALAPPTVGPGETLIAVYPLSFPAADVETVSPVIEGYEVKSPEVIATIEAPLTEVPVNTTPATEVAEPVPGT